jgi:hypothetical protein
LNIFVGNIQSFTHKGATFNIYRQTKHSRKLPLDSFGAIGKVSSRGDKWGIVVENGTYWDLPTNA